MSPALQFRFNRTVGRALIGLFVFLTLTKVTRADAVLDLTDVMLNAIRAQNSPPTLASRNLAILHVAMYDAVNAIRHIGQPYQTGAAAPVGASAEAAAVAAGHLAIVELYPSSAQEAEDYYTMYLAGEPATETFTNSLKFGAAIASQILTTRIDDGSATDVPYVPSDEPGQWRRTPPFFRPPVAPQWRYVRPFCLPTVEPFVPPGPPDLLSQKYADDVNLTKQLGSKTSSTRTDEQTLIAQFWSDFAFTSTPPGHWAQMAVGVARARNNTLEQNARLFALMSLSQADSGIVCWEAKYRYNAWRPVTAIQQADEVGNAFVTADTNWVSLLVAPSFPEYTSGHSTFSKASATVLANFYGTDAVTFMAVSDAMPGIVRTYASFAECADEIGMSRIYGGIHFMSANRDGKTCGKLVAEYVLNNFLQTDDRLPALYWEKQADGSARIRVHGHVGATCVVEASTDVTHWTQVASGKAVIGGFVVEGVTTDAVQTRFFRVVE